MSAFATSVGHGIFGTGAAHGLLRHKVSVVRPKRLLPTCKATTGQQFQVSTRGKAFGTVGALALTAALVNRVGFTDLLTPYQSRADIVAVVCGVSLLVYAAGTAEVSERSAEVAQTGVGKEFESTLTRNAEAEARFVTGAALGAVKNIRAAAIFAGGRCVARQGLFRTDAEMDALRTTGVAVRQAAEENATKYFADLRVMPTREAEFGFFPQQCQAVVVVPLGSTGAAVFGADKVRPLKGVDFGWLTAICNRLGAELEKGG